MHFSLFFLNSLFDFLKMDKKKLVHFLIMDIKFEKKPARLFLLDLRAVFLDLRDCLLYLRVAIINYT